MCTKARNERAESWIRELTSSRPLVNSRESERTSERANETRDERREEKFRLWSRLYASSRWISRASEREREKRVTYTGIYTDEHGDVLNCHDRPRCWPSFLSFSLSLSCRKREKPFKRLNERKSELLRLYGNFFFSPFCTVLYNVGIWYMIGYELGFNLDPNLLSCKHPIFCQ